jgi:hypothetical protein
MKSPLALVKEKFTDKKSLVTAVQKFTGEELWVAKTSKNKGLGHVSNAKLLRLHQTFSQVKEKFGTRFKLIDAIIALESRAKDEGYRSRLLAFPVPRLWDMYKSAEKRKGAGPGAAKAPAEKAAAPKAKAKTATAAPSATKKKTPPKA